MIGICCKCGCNAHLDSLGSILLCPKCFDEEDKRLQDEFEEGQAELERFFLENPELYFCDDVAREYLWDYFHEDDEYDDDDKYEIEEYYCRFSC